MSRSVQDDVVTSKWGSTGVFQCLDEKYFLLRDENVAELVLLALGDGRLRIRLIAELAIDGFPIAKGVILLTKS